MINTSSLWERLPVVELCEAHVDCVNRTAPVVDQVTPFKMLRTTNVRHGYVDTENVRYVTGETFARWTRRLVPRKGDIILTREAPLGDVGKIRTEESVFLGQRLYHFRPDSKRLDADFLLYSLLSDDLQSQIKAFGSGSTVEHMRLEDIPSLEFNVPPLPIQRRIAGILSAYDDLIENSQRRIKILEEMARRLYREWFVKNQAEKAWGETRLGDLIELKRGYDLPARDRRAGAFPIVSSSGVTGLHDRSMASGPGIVTGRYGTLGEVHLIWNDFWPLNTSLYVKNFKGTPFLYVFWLLRNILPDQKGSAAAVPGINRNDLHSLLVSSPPQSVMQDFHDLCLPLATQAKCLAGSIDNLRRTRDLLLPRLLSGQIDVEALPEPVLSES